MRAVAYIVYMFLMFVIGGVLMKAGIGITAWQFWVIVGCYLIVYLCGIYYG